MKYMIMILVTLVLIFLVSVSDGYKTIVESARNIELFIMIIVVAILIYVVASLEKEDKREELEKKASLERFDQNQIAIPVDLTTGTWICGEDIAPGRYTATALPSKYLGTLSIRGSANITESLRASSEVTNVTCSIQLGDTVKISGIPTVHFEPVKKTN